MKGGKGHGEDHVHRNNRKEPVSGGQKEKEPEKAVGSRSGGKGNGRVCAYPGDPVIFRGRPGSDRADPYGPNGDELGCSYHGSVSDLGSALRSDSTGIFPGRPIKEGQKKRSRGNGSMGHMNRSSYTNHRS